MLPDVLQLGAYGGTEVRVETFFDHGLSRNIAKIGRQHLESELIGESIGKRI
jgi:hypothetical protein